MGTTVVFGRLFNSPIHYPGKMTETIIRCKYRDFGQFHFTLAFYPYFFIIRTETSNYTIFSDGIKVRRRPIQHFDECSK